MFAVSIKNFISYVWIGKKLPLKKMEAKPTAQLVTLAAFLPWGSSQGAC